MRRSLESLNQLDLSESSATKQSGVSDGSHKEALVMIFSIICLPVIDHPQNGVVYNFGRVCMSVCM